jgi:tetratricopeptide (TPR) repeat protein
LKFEKNNNETFVSIGSHKEKSPFLSDAIDYYKKALKLSKNDDFYLYSLGYLYCLTGNNDQGLKFINKAIEIEPNVAIYHIVKGLILEKSESSILQAFNEYKTSLILSPELINSCFYKDFSQRFPVRKQQIIDEAIKELYKSEMNNPINEAKLGSLYLSNEQTDSAFNILSRVTKVIPNINRPWFYLGNIYRQRNDTINMVLCYKRAAFLDYGDVLPVAALADYYCSIKQFKTASDYYKKTLTKWLNAQSYHSNNSQYIYLTKALPNCVMPANILYYLKSTINFNNIKTNVHKIPLSETDKYDFDKLFKLIKYECP